MAGNTQRYTLQLELPEEQKEQMLAEYRDSDLTPVEVFLQRSYLPRAVEEYQRGDSNE